MDSPIRRLRQFTATVTAAVGTPTGSVVFVIDGDAPYQRTIAMSAGTASFTTQLFLGKHTITAHYNGDTNFQSGDAAPLIYYVTPRPR